MSLVSLYLESWLLCMRSLTTTPARSLPLLPLFCSSLLLHCPLDSPNWSGTIWVGRPLRPRGHHRVALLGGRLGGCWWSPSGYGMRDLSSINRWGMARTSSLFSYSSVKWSPLAAFVGSDVTPILTLDLTSIGKVEKLISLLIFRVDVPTLFQWKLH